MIATAQQLALTQISYSPQFQSDLNRNLGPREGVDLQRDVTTALTQALARRGVTVGPNAPISLSVEIVSARPNAPTDAQIDDAMAGNVCRCATYTRIRKAIKQAA